MKKAITSLLVIFSAVFLVACKDKTKDTINEIIEEIKVVETTTKDISLPKTSEKNKDAKLTWATSHPNVISTTGTVTRQDADVNVTLTLTVELNKQKEEKPYVVKVVKKEETVVVNPVDYTKFNNPYGFASLAVKNRVGKTVKEVATEIEFLEALLDTSNKVIKITEDLNMGHKNVVKKLEEAGASADKIKELTNNNKLYRQNSNIPLLHPILKEEGVGQLIIDGREDLMIYSEKGITIRHLTTHVKGNTKDLVIRNIKFADIWEWDEEDRGQFKVNDWDFFTLENVNGVWFDHLTFTNAYDGVIDAKANVENVTLSYLDLNFVQDEFILAQMNWLEENIDTKDAKYYKELREKASKEDITTVAASHKKGFNFGNTTDGAGFENITVTMHNIHAKNLQDRFPRLRKGDVHLYNVISDASDIAQLRNIGIPVVNQAIVPTERGAVLMENSIFKNVSEAIKTHQDSNLDPRYTGRYEIRNSQYIYGEDSYFGSSINNVIWKQSNTNAEKLDFYFRNWQEVPYKYDMVEAKDLVALFEKNKPGIMVDENMNWLKIDESLSQNKTDRGQLILSDLITGLEPAVVKKGDAFTPSFEVYNYYGNNKLVQGKDYTFVTKNSADTNVDGIYTVTYVITSSKDSKNVVEVTQEIVVYDENKENEIYQSTFSDEWNQTVNAKLNVYTAKGDLYYLVSNDATITKENLLANGKVYQIEQQEINLNNIDTKQGTYIHFITKSNELTSKLVSHKIEKETIIEINNATDFNQMLKETSSKGKYYLLKQDIDFSGITLEQNSSFEGVFDGNGFTIKNIKAQADRKGIFGSLKDAAVKNIVLETIELKTPNNDRNGLLSSTVSGTVLIENIKFNNIKIVSNKNKLGLITGEVSLNGNLTIKQISATNIYLKSNKLTSILIGEMLADTNVLVSDVYMNHTEIDTPKKEGAAGIVANMVGGSKLTVNNIYSRDFKVDASHNIGFIVGKIAANSTLDADHVFAEYTKLTTVKENNNTIVGNVDGVANLTDAIFTLGINKADGNKGLSAKVILEAGTVINEAWILENMPLISKSNLWEFANSELTLK